MTPGALEKAALALPGATLSIQWGDDRVYKVGGKMFAATNGTSSNLSMKMTDIAFEALTETGPPRQAPYLAKGHWVIVDLADIAADELASWLASSHSLIAAKLTRQVKRELGIA